MKGKILKISFNCDRRNETNKNQNFIACEFFSCYFNWISSSWNNSPMSHSTYEIVKYKRVNWIPKMHIRPFIIFFKNISWPFIHDFTSFLDDLIQNFQKMCNIFVSTKTYKRNIIKWISILYITNQTASYRLLFSKIII